MNLDDAMEKAQAHLDAKAEDETTPEPAPVETAPAETTETAPAAEAKSDRARDESGKFTRAPKAKASKATQEPAVAAPKGGVHGAASAAPPAGQGTADGAAPPLPAPSAAPASDLKAPSSWKPGAREAFAKAPREVQEEAIRIDREVRQVLQHSAEARRTVEAFQRTLGPFDGVARANGMDAMTFAGEGARAMAAVYSGAPQAAAQVIANAIQTLDQRTGGKALDIINAVLSGQPAPSAPAQHVDPREEIRRALAEEREAQHWDGRKRQAEAFEANPPEDYALVKPLMIRLAQIDTASGGNKTPEQLYEEACRLSPEYQDKQRQKKEAERVRTATAATQAAQAATQVSLRSTAAAPVRAKPKGLDAAMSAAREKLGM